MNIILTTENCPFTADFLNFSTSPCNALIPEKQNKIMLLTKTYKNLECCLSAHASRGISTKQAENNL